MTQHLDWKKFQFITEVQTALIGNAMRASLKKDSDRDHFVSSTSMLTLLQTAFVAAEQIPADLSAHDAACQIVPVLIYPEDNELPDWVVHYE